MKTLEQNNKILKEFYKKIHYCTYDTHCMSIEDVDNDFRNGEILITDLEDKKYSYLSYLKKIHGYIEAAILGLPLPTIFLADRKKNIFEVVDGAKRIVTFSKFIDDQIVLEDLKILNELNGCKFSDLPTSLQQRFLKYHNRVVIFDNPKFFRLHLLRL